MKSFVYHFQIMRKGEEKPEVISVASCKSVSSALNCLEASEKDSDFEVASIVYGGPILIDGSIVDFE